MKTQTILSIVLIPAICISIAAVKYIPKIEIENATISPGGLNVGEFSYEEYLNAGEKKFTIEGRRIHTAGKGFSVLRVNAVQTIELKDVRVTFYEKNTPLSIMCAKKAVLNTIPAKEKNILKAFTSRIDFRDSVSVMTKERRTLTCERLIWDNKQNRFSAKEGCELSYDGRSVKADIIDSDIELKRFNFKNEKNKRLKAFLRTLT
jgi:hypothetical protein